MRRRYFLVCVGLVLVVFFLFIFIEWNNSAFSSLVGFSRNRETITKAAACGIRPNQSGHRGPTQKQCKVPVYRYENWTDEFHSRRCPLCTNDLLREAARQTNGFPYRGSWILDSSTRTSTEESFRFHPDFCSFSNKELDQSYVRSCLQRKNIRKIVSLGDPNSRKFVEALVQILTKVLDGCSMAATETIGHKPNPVYYLGNFSFNASDITFTDSLCHSCTQRFVCSYETVESDGSKRTRTLKLEQIAVTRIIDGMRRVNRKIGDILPTNISQEFLLRDYIRLDGGYPDVLSYIAPFMHEVASGGLTQGPNSVGRLRGKMKALLEMFHKYIPVSTSVYWSSEQNRCGTDRSTLQRNKLIRSSANVLFDVIRDDLTGGGSTNMHPFLNLYELSCPATWLQLSKDPVHMKPAWYHTVAKFFLELHCNS